MGTYLLSQSIRGFDPNKRRKIAFSGNFEVSFPQKKTARKGG